ncbi:hypothetical protein BJ875DRAFT_447771 [Amylocarpus encephaloides]|uniref:Zn(2)-C6 fungal-type domain-containing protein n=1 Tax=Amylocarpus encephaloides TaxID=45428 RepID=A0A9P7YTX4_9HELO|nr:hypothetical protein BJ875DRAFT_447771 [Amylocarpus encephaloides]
MSDMMHGSTSNSLRPRQRTFTSCTECRRRKQKCNQAKDRPCSNCARRYPPPVCTYQSSSPTPPPMDHVLTLGDEDGESDRTNQTNRSNAPVNAPMVSTSQYYSGHSATSISPDQHAYGAYSTPSPPSRSDGRYYADSLNGHPMIASTSGGEMYPVAAGYYHTDHLGYSTTEASQDYGYLTASDQQQWLSSENPDVFIGTGTAEYFYVDDGAPGKSNRG